MNTQELVGFLLVNKPQDSTSFAVIRQIRNIIGKGIRVGHTGTLDPFATGLLIVAIGRSATKQCRNLLTLDKTYTATGKLGELTDTLDLTGTIEKRNNVSITLQQLEDALVSLGDSYMQAPPVYSAVKHRGVPLYKLARQKKVSLEELQAIAQNKQREVILHKMVLRDFSPPSFTIEAQVSHGTYMRLLINDIAQQAGSIATTYELTRTAIGPFLLKDALPLHELISVNAIQNALIKDLFIR